MNDNKYKYVYDENDATLLPLLLIVMRLVGGLLVAYSFHNILLLFCSMDGERGSEGEGGSESKTIHRPHRYYRRVLIINEIGSFALGIIVLAVGLVSVRGLSTSTSSASDYHKEYGCTFHDLILVAWGSVIVVMNCIALMASFYPAKYEDDHGDGNDYNYESDRDLHRNEPINDTEVETNADDRNAIDSDLRIGIGTGTDENDLQVPLLSGEQQQRQQYRQHQEPLQSLFDNNTLLDIEAHSNEEENYMEGTEEEIPPSHENENESNEMDRITGTKRLIQIAGRQRFYLYAGCLVLLIRLPFSLSIPHFVSETIGALARAEYGIAKSNSK